MHSLKSRRGSVLIVALIFAAIVAIALTSYLKLALGSLKMANRAFYLNGAENVADVGLEQALWSLNNSTWTGSGGFTSIGSGQYRGTFPSTSTYFSLSGNAKSQVKVWVDTTYVHGGIVTPRAISMATITLGDGSTINKMSEAYLKQLSYSNQPMVARTGLSFTGNVSIDSWDSKSDTDSTADDVKYSTTSRNTEAGVASTSLGDGSVSVQNADVYGRAAVGTDDASAISVGPNGRIAGSFGAGTGIDYSRVTYDFTTSFPDIPVPTTSGVTLPSISGATNLPRAGDSPAADGKYYYYTPSISMSGNSSNVVNIGPAVASGANPAKTVVIVITNTTGTGVSFGGQAGVNINPASKLEIYTSANVNIAGNGVMNGGTTSALMNNPANFHLYGTRSAAAAAISGMQTIGIKGNGILSGVVNAPNADVSVNGNGDTFGSVFANHVTLVGNGAFHADESLARIASSGLWGVQKWREITSSTERATYASSQLRF